MKKWLILFFVVFFSVWPIYLISTLIDNWFNFNLLFLILYLFLYTKSFFSFLEKRRLNFLVISLKWSLVVFWIAEIGIWLYKFYI